MQHQDLDLSLAVIAASARRIMLATLAVIAVAALLSALAYAFGRWA